MKKLLLINLLLIGINLFSQKDSLILELKPDTVLEKVNFSCSELLDIRNSKDNIGFIKNGKKPVYFKDGFKNHLKTTIDYLLPEVQNKTELTFIIRDFKIVEDIGTQNQYGFCYIEIEFAKHVDTTLYSLGVFNTMTSENNMKIKYTHEERILKTIIKCIEKFNNSNTKIVLNKTITNLKNDTILNYKKCPRKGAYLSYNQMIRNTPIDDVEYKIEKTNKSKYEVHSITTTDPNHQKMVQFVSDGENIYMQYNNNDFLKSQTYGKYIFFEGNIPTTYSTNVNPSAGFLVGFSFGLVGAYIFYATSTTPNLAVNNKYKGAVIETETGNLKMITNMYLHRITKPYPLLIKEYRKSKRKPDDQLKVIKELNKKF